MNLFSWGWATLIRCFIAGKGFPSLVPTILSVSAVLAVTSCVYIYNDITDMEMDKLNPEKGLRPLPAGVTLKNTAMQLVYITGIVGVLLSLFLNRTSQILLYSYLILFTIYSHPTIRLKDTLSKSSWLRPDTYSPP